MSSRSLESIPTNSNGPEFLPELENHPFPVLGRNFSPRARFPIPARVLVLQQNSEKHPRVDIRKIRAGIPGTRAGIPRNRARKNEELVFDKGFSVFNVVSQLLSKIVKKTPPGENFSLRRDLSIGAEFSACNQKG